MFAFHAWWLINNTDIFDVVDSHWLSPTEERPTISEYLKTPISTLLRILTGWVSRERKSFGYRWWNSQGLPFNCLPPVNSLIAATYDLGKAFRYGVYIK